MSDQKNSTLCIYHGNCADGFGAESWNANPWCWVVEFKQVIP